MKQWPKVPLKDICEYVRGLTYPKSDESDTVTPVVVLRANNLDLRSYSFDLSDLKFLKPTASVPKEKLIHNGDTIICTSSGSRAHLGKAVYSDRDTDCAFGGFLAAIRAKEDKVLSKFLFYSLTSAEYRSFIQRSSEGININNLKSSTFLSFQILLPSLQTQKEIVAILDAGMALRKKRDEADQKMATFAPALFHQMFGDPARNERGWEMKKIGELVDSLDNKRKPITKSDRVAGAIPYYGATGILDHVNGYLFDEKLVLIGEDGAKWGPGDNSAFIIEGKSWVNNHAHVVRPHRDHILDEFLVAALIKMDLKGFISGITVPKLNQARLNSVLLPVPPLGLQRLFVDRVAEVGIIGEKQKMQKTLISQMYNGLIQDLL